MRRNIIDLNKVIRCTKDRVSESVSWFPYPCLFSFGLIIILSGHILLGINPRLGNPAVALPFDAEPLDEGAIWLSVSIANEKVTITTDDRKVFSWDQSSRESNVVDKLVEHLQERTVQITLSTSLAKEISQIESTVILSIDQKVKFLHVKPILLALAKAGISEYGFETRLP